MLAVSGLEVVYHGVAKVLANVSLTVAEGQIVALLGPNGAGKTSLLRAITGLLSLHEGAITKGSITLAGEAITGDRPERIVRRGLAQVMEGRRIFTELSVEENLLAGAFARKDDVRAELERWYTRFPRLAERRRQTAGLLPAASSRCSRLRVPC